MTPAAGWVGAVGQSELDRLCPRNGEVQALANAVAADVRASGNYMGEQDFGNKVYKGIENIVNAERDPNFRAKASYHSNIELRLAYGARGSIRLDVLEQIRPATVCVYDHKTGKTDLRPTRAVDIMTIVQKNFFSRHDAIHHDRRATAAVTAAREVRQIYRTIMGRHANLKETGSRFLCEVPVHRMPRLRGTVPPS